MSTLFKKLNLKDQTRIVVLDAPDSFDAELAQLDGVQVETSLKAGRDETFVMAFVLTQAALDGHSAAVAKRAPGDAVVWMVYPKKSSKRYTCEFSRDSGWAVLTAAGFETVRMVAVDEDWSALRFRRTEFVRR